MAGVRAVERESGRGVLVVPLLTGASRSSVSHGGNVMAKQHRFQTSSGTLIYLNARTTYLEP